MNKHFRFFSFLSFLPLLLWAFATIQSSSADGSVAEDIKMFVPKKEIRSNAEQKTIRVIKDPSEIKLSDDGEEIESTDDQLPEWVKPARWFRSNAAGMALEEVPSRFTVLRNEYALVIDFINAEELPAILAPYYSRNQYIEVRALYHNKQESRRQFIFRKKDGTTRVVAVLREVDNTEKPDVPVDKVVIVPVTVIVDEIIIGDSIDNMADDEAIADDDFDDLIAEDEDAPAIPPLTGKSLVGFVEIYNENELLAQDIVFSGTDGTRYAEYFYRKGVLVRAEFSQSIVEDGVKKLSMLFTDDYRYNRSGSLRSVERIYHEQTEEFVRLSFPHRVLDAARMEFITEKLYIAPEFFGTFVALPNQRLVFNTDERGRILAQTLYDEEDEMLWSIVNNWKGDRIASAVKTIGDDVLLVEYEYDSRGKRIVERDLRNGVLERLVRAEGKTEIEELMIEGAVVLRAVWEDGRKVSERRLRNKGETVQ